MRKLSEMHAVRHPFLLCATVGVALLWFQARVPLAADKELEPKEIPAAKTMEDVVPLTAANLRGHKLLFKEGYFIIPSAEKALKYAEEKSVHSSRQAVLRATRDVATESSEYAGDLKSDIGDSAAAGTQAVRAGTGVTTRIARGTGDLAAAEGSYSKEHFAAAWTSFVLGSVRLAERTQEDRQELRRIPGGYFKHLRDDFGNIWDLVSEANKHFALKISLAWDRAFRRAGREFRAEYEESGRKGNALEALGPILHGYIKALHEGLAAPAAKTLVSVAAVGGTDAVFLPAAESVLVSGRTVQAVGLTLFYTGRTGVHIVTPAAEGGALCALAMLSAGAVPPTYAGGAALSAVNQVAFTSGGIAYGTGRAATTMAFHTSKYVGLVVFDAGKGATKVTINQAQSGIVLGYSALTSIPAHLLMGVADAAIMLAWDGPRLVIVAVKGSPKSGTESGQSDVFPAAELPVGTVVDLKRLEETGNGSVEVLSEDPAVIGEVLRKTHCDLRDQEAPCETEP